MLAKHSPPFTIDAKVAANFYECVKKTSKCRFIGSKRIRTGVELATKLTAWYSCFTILVSVLSAVGINFLGQPALTASLLVFASVVILAVSLLFGSSARTEAAVHMHHCGKRLNSLAKEIEKHRRTGILKIDEEEFSSYVKQYENILHGLENHSTLDYLQYQFEEQSKRSSGERVAWAIKIDTRLKMMCDFPSLFLAKILSAFVVIAFTVAPPLVLYFYYAKSFL